MNKEQPWEKKLRYYTFWLWQYEVRNENDSNTKLFKGKDFSHEGCPNNKISSDELIKSYIDEKFNPCGPRINFNEWHDFSCSATNVTCEIENKIYTRRHISVDIDCAADLKKIGAEIHIIVTRQKLNAYISNGGADQKIIQAFTKSFTNAENYLDKQRMNGKPDFHKEGAGRLVGLWLWDYIRNEYGREKIPYGGLTKAIEALKNNFSPNDWFFLGYSGSQQKVIEDKWRGTCKCIEQCEVLPF